MAARNLNGFWQTTAYGLTMEWLVSRSTPFNAANPFRISGYVNGECRMSHAIRATTAQSLKRCEERVTARLAEIAKESESHFEPR
jgi:hypothetical protein